MGANSTQELSILQYLSAFCFSVWGKKGAWRVEGFPQKEIKGGSKKKKGGSASTTLNQADTHSVNYDNKLALLWIRGSPCNK